MKPNTYHAHNFTHYRTYGPVQAWNNACQDMHRRHKNMLRTAGVYKPGSEHYPMPEPGTEYIHTRISNYFQRLRAQEHMRLINALTPQERETIYGY